MTVRKRRCERCGQPRQRGAYYCSVDCRDEARPEHPPRKPQWIPIQPPSSEPLTRDELADVVAKALGFGGGVAHMDQAHAEVMERRAKAQGVRRG